MELFKKLFDALNQEKVEYLLCGGIAVNLYGIERATADIDLVLRLNEENLTRLVRAAKKLGLKPKIPVKIEELISPEKRQQWRIEKNMRVFSLYDEKAPFFVIDILIEEPFNFVEVYKRRKEINLSETVIPLVPIDVLIKMKEKTGRLQDEADVFYLRKIMEEWRNG
ncbi:MAG: nucleotidyl transferase AbiEii/AbiGii toxin family protein [Thermodesulfovibrionaceae bacterium]